MTFSSNKDLMTPHLPSRKEELFILSKAHMVTSSMEDPDNWKVGGLVKHLLLKNHLVRTYLSLFWIECD